MVRAVLCQVRSAHSVRENLEKIGDTVRSVKGDIYLFPEMFLSGYGAEIPDDTVLDDALRELRSLSEETDSAIAVGMPRREDGKVFNSLPFVTPYNTRIYDKIHLANFGKYDESVFSPGGRPVIAEWKGMKFGLLVCYDIFFPELSRYYAVNGADAVLMASASATTSKQAMETMLPARSLENTVYTVFCNNIGPFGNGEFYGGSSVYSPSGRLLTGSSSGEEVTAADLDPDLISIARKERPHLRDRRTGIYRISPRPQPNLFM